MKSIYENQYSKVTPIPFLSHKIFGIEEIFVQGGIKFCTSDQGKGHPKWTTLESYQDIAAKKAPITSFLRIVEGDPGQGKSTLALQFVYDWCTKKCESPLKDVDLLVFLQLRQLRNIKNIFQAIKLLLLPKYTSFTEETIKSIIQKCSSVVFILDGYDEFPNRNEQNDINDMIKTLIFHQAMIILTTRSNFRPKEYAQNSTFFKLTGFDEKARNEYLFKVVQDDRNVAERLKQRLDESPVLGEFILVPLFFAMYAHITYERDDQVMFDSVTKFFRYMISCFHSHLGNKPDNNKDMYQSLEKAHESLEELAFNGLSGKKEKNIWSKEEMCANLGQNIFEYYLDIGILVSEEVRRIIDEPGISDSEHIQDVTEVRFYHKLFCEWYAAHYLSKHLNGLSETDMARLLNHLDPFNLQYVYRFVCGLNPDVAPTIIAYLKTLHGGDKFAILCLLEKTGDIEQIKETVTELCLETVILSNESSRLLQRSTLQLIDIACKLKVSSF